MELHRCENTGFHFRVAPFGIQTQRRAEESPPASPAQSNLESSAVRDGAANSRVRAIVFQPAELEKEVGILMDIFDGYGDDVAGLTSPPQKWSAKRRARGVR